MIADSGCQSSIIPVVTALSLGYSKNNILPVKLSMKGAISEDIGIEGEIILKVTVKDENGKSLSCKQLTYMCRKINKAFLCREALEQLGIISPNFPEISTDRTFNVSTEKGRSCNCPRRVKEIPSMPQDLPDGLTGRDEDVPALKEWLLQYYGSTAFNVCEHQPLPLMNCEPLKL